MKTMTKDTIGWKDLKLQLTRGHFDHDEDIRLDDPEFWDPVSLQDVPHLGRFYRNQHHYLPLILKDKEKAAERVAVLEKDVCPEKYSRFFVYP